METNAGFLWGMMVGFLGSLPLGTLNVLAMKIGIEEGFKNALYFSFGSLLTEMIYVRISLVGINWIRRLEWVTFFIVVALAVGSFMTAIKHHHSGQPIENNLPDFNRFVLGISLSAVSPMQIPFWFGWSTVLFTKKVLLPKNSFLQFIYCWHWAGNINGKLCFHFGGKWIVEKLNANQNILNYVLGGIFTLTAIIQLIKILLHKDAADKLDHLEVRPTVSDGLKAEPNKSL